MGIENLSEDLLMEILCMLPVKTLVQFKSVCKNWYALIQNPDFISFHLDRSASIAAAENTDCLLVKRFLDGGVALSFVPNETPVEDIDISFTRLDIKDLQILGPCNGVVCLTKFGSSSPIVLCNPSMKECRVLPEPSYKSDHMCNLGFGFDPSANDYKVVRFGMTSTDFTITGVDKAVEMYDLSTDSWRDVDTESPILSGFECFSFYHLYASWNGDFFWYAYNKHGDSPVIMAFCMFDEVFKEIHLPEGCLLNQRSDSKIFVLNNSLAIVFPSQELWIKSFDIWVMNEEDVEVSWTKKFSIGPFQGRNWALGFRKNGEFLMENGYGQMVSYNLNTRERKEYQVHDQVQGWPPPPHIQALPYTESLVSVKRHN